IVKKSDDPGPMKGALDYDETGGLLLAMKDLGNLPSSQYHFNNSGLESDLNSLVNAIQNLDEMSKQAFLALNAKISGEVKSLKGIFSSSKFATVFSNKFNASTGKKTKITLKIKTKDSSGKRDVGDFVITTIASYYERAAVEIIPIANVVMANNIPRFYIENGIVKQSVKDTIGLTPGFLLNFNLTTFGEAREWAAGIALGYNISKNSNLLQHISLNGIISYRNWGRIGLGIGYTQLPYGLKEGAKVDSPLPSNISDLKNIVSYEGRITGFLVLSFTGLKIGNGNIK
ncbi:MAG: hypothetical protein ABUL44_00780, partial [Flavobacterium sp.]